MKTNRKKGPLKRTPLVAENGDIRGKDNDGDGRIETIHVEGYFKKDGSRVRGHYRAPSKKKK